MSWSPSDYAGHLLSIGPVFDYFFRNIQADFLYHSKNVSFRWWSVWPYNEVWSSQKVEIQYVIVDIVADILQLSQLLSRICRFHIECRV